MSDLLKTIFTADFVARLLRSALQVLGGVIATRGWMDDATWTTISGAVLTIGTTMFTWWSSYKATST